MTDQVSEPVIEASAPVVEAAPVITEPVAEAKADPEVKVEPKTGEAKPEGAPESYDFGDTEIDSVIADVYKAAAKDLNLTNDAAKTLLDKVAPVYASRLAEVQAEMHQATISDWEQKAASDKEYGGEKFQENLAVAKQFLDTFGDQELSTFLKETGLGSNPALIRAFWKAGNKISPDSKVVTGGSGNAFNTAAQSMYPNMNP